MLPDVVFVTPGLREDMGLLDGLFLCGPKHACVEPHVDAAKAIGMNWHFVGSSLTAFETGSAAAETAVMGRVLPDVPAAAVWVAGRGGRRRDGDVEHLEDGVPGVVFGVLGEVANEPAEARDGTRGRFDVEGPREPEPQRFAELSWAHPGSLLEGGVHPCA